MSLLKACNSDSFAPVRTSSFNQTFRKEWQSPLARRGGKSDETRASEMSPSLKLEAVRPSGVIPNFISLIMTLTGTRLIYSTAELFTSGGGPGSTRVLGLYGGAGETHEFALARHLANPAIIEGDDISFHGEVQPG